MEDGSRVCQIDPKNKLSRSQDAPGKADVMVAGVKTGGQSTSSEDPRAAAQLGEGRGGAAGQGRGELGAEIPGKR